MPSPNGNRLSSHAGNGGSSSWLVLKFGGTSVASATRWRRIGQILEERLAAGQRLLVVCSAVAGTTDDLESLPDLDPAARERVLTAIRKRHLGLIKQLGLGPVSAVEAELESLTRTALTTGTWDDRARARLLAHGELLSTRLGEAQLNRVGIPTRWLDARDLLHARHDVPEPSYLSTECDYSFSGSDRAELEACPERVFITQGFIARNPAGETVLLGRGGSDTAATYLASRIGAEEVEIWTDVPGLFTANPRVVPGARLIRSLTYDEAETLAAMGAAALHPRSLTPLREAQIRMRIGWTDHPEALGTFIHGPVEGSGEPGVKAVSSRTGLLLISAQREARWQPVGYMADVAACFGNLGICMDLVASSPSDIRVTIDRESNPDVVERLPDLLDALGKVAEIQVFPEVGSVSLVGREIRRELPRVAETLRHLDGHDIHLISQAPNDLSLTYVTELESTLPLIRDMHHELFDDRDEGTFGDTWLELQASNGVMPAGRPEPMAAGSAA